MDRPDGARERDSGPELFARSSSAVQSVSIRDRCRVVRAVTCLPRLAALTSGSAA